MNENYSVLMPTTKISHDWYQTIKLVIVEVRSKGLKSEQVEVDIASTALGVLAKLQMSIVSNGIK